MGPLTQFRQRAMMRATVVLPVPRWPERIYPWAIRCSVIAFCERGSDVFLADQLRKRTPAGICAR